MGDIDGTCGGLSALVNSCYLLTLYLKFNIHFVISVFCDVKGAVREIRKDNQFLAKQKLKEQLER